MGITKVCEDPDSHAIALSNGTTCCGFPLFSWGKVFVSCRPLDDGGLMFPQARVKPSPILMDLPRHVA